MFKLHKGGWECQKRDHSSPKTGVCRDTDFNLRRDPIIAKAVKMADRYHNPDPLIRLIGPVNESTVILKGLTDLNRALVF